MSTESAVTIEVLADQDVCVLRLKGRFVAGIDPEYVLSSLDEIKRRACRRMVVDLSQITSMGSIGIGFLVGLYTSMTKNPDGRFVLAGANSRVREVLAITRLDTVIPQAADLAAGLASLRSAGKAAS